MKILMILDREFPPDIRVENEIESLVSAGYNVHIACYTRKNKKSREEYKSYTIHRKPISNFIYKSSVACLKLPFYFSFWKKFVFQLLKMENFDVIHIHDLPLAKIGSLARKKYHTPFILDLHENWPAYLRISTHTQNFLGKLLSNNKQWINYEKKYVTLANKVIVVVNEAKERLQNITSDQEKITVVSNTLNLKEVSGLKKKIDNEYITLFYGGGINFHRGLQTVILAMDEIISKNKKIRLWIVGDGSYKNELEKICDKMNLNPYIKFYGFKPFNEMLDLLSQSDIALIPHLVSDHTNSTIPHKLFQYMYYEKPIISSDCLPIKRILDETKTGVTYNSKNVKELSELVLDIASNQEKYDSMKKNGKFWVNNKYNWDIDTQNLLKIYDTLNK